IRRDGAVTPPVARRHHEVFVQASHARTTTSRHHRSAEARIRRATGSMVQRTARRLRTRHPALGHNSAASVSQHRLSRTADRSTRAGPRSRSPAVDDDVVRALVSAVSRQPRATSLIAMRSAHPRIVIVAASLDLLGGHGVQAISLIGALAREGIPVAFLPINPTFPLGLRWIRRWPYLRTLVNQSLYLPSLLRLRHADVVHAFSASYASFLLAPLPAMLMGRLLRRRVIL